MNERYPSQSIRRKTMLELMVTVIPGGIPAGRSLLRCSMNERYPSQTIRRKTMLELMVTVIPLKMFGLLYRRVGAGAAGVASKFLPRAGAV
jgi:hypothetical protein